MTFDQTKTRKIRAGLVGLAALLLVPQTGIAQSPTTSTHGAEFVKDGVLYRTVVRNIQRPVVDQRMEKEEKTFYRPETVRETKPQVSTTYVPVTEVKYRPYLEGRWNPFQQPTVAYRPVTETHWEARSEVVNRTTTETRWIPEKRTVEVPHSIVRYENEQQVEYQPIARVMPPPSVGGTANTAVASRLRPLSGTNQLIAARTSGVPLAQVASNIVGRATSDQPQRSSTQSGMKKNVLIPSGAPGARMLPGTPGVGIATVPSFSLRR